MNVVDPTNVMEVKLRVHEVPSQEQSFRGLKAAFVHAEAGFWIPLVAMLWCWQKAEGIDQSVVIEPPIGDASMMGIP